MRRVIYSAFFLLAACTIDTGTGRSTFTPPVISQSSWRATGYPFEGSDTAYCVIDGGQASIRVVLELTRGANEAVPFIESARRMRPGTMFQVRSTDHSYRTYYDSLTAAQSRTILDDLMNGQTVYLRWSEVNGGDEGRINFTNRASPEDFRAPYQECLSFIRKQAGA